ncbi:nickel pincer cofactor biosynthesis protein LarB [Synechococcus sp. GFB01]|uniref:nickel pincer cofactor biosynthesis protein LarB n=1 Tax=Synechococcus sp. GFB01 TaxID=1662190 RepID=UPI00064F582C|nr:nickel pincer cofactor biosynthesis protein LarB [Synechococcus sp. GFB01]KMM16886.1 circadian phase modifier CpmA [Synechococcus sp. GFB01]
MTRQHRLDLGRRRRLGMVEAIWGEHKSAEQIAAILRELHAAGELALATRLAPGKAEAVAASLDAHPEMELRHHAEARCLTAGRLPEPGPLEGRVAVLSGGTSDLPVAAEARLALACHGVAAELVLDVGVAGLHRLLDQLEALRQADVLIACAGMEGALPTVLAGLLPQPVIGVPVAVGYGVSAGGTAALHGMLASCAPGLMVVNIDNGYGAAMAALRILRGWGDGRSDRSAAPAQAV